ncbi:MBL fold metallo-hydrolase [Bacteroides propionicifaciens]|uniref:MBL fold metallo-hydrolase n=1 Tax=Bacteroides propionicifaciens TaxID=392838 RepID=UPI000469DCF0|nr:MBL fold metallo-hydrolase [Bacteroides propionicifaciens]
MKLYYIFHSCFAIETSDLVIIVDYYKDSEQDDKGLVHDQLLKTQKKLYVLSTHAHHDHFNPEILSWVTKRNDIQYILSKDILDARLSKKEDAYYIDKGESYEDEHLSVEAFGSTDQGSSFLIHLGNKLIFHAGDLNNWHWKAESSPQESQLAEEWYLRELTDIYRKYKAIDLVMFPIDKRLQTDYYLGAKQFIEKIETSYIAPMHFHEDYIAVNAFEAVAKEYDTQFLKLTHRGQEFDLKL